jgi:Gpi18-like mannosyltransferase
MTASPVSLPDRESVWRLAWRLETPLALAGMFAAALVVRLLIAPQVGFSSDLGYFRTWAIELRHVGPRDFYSVEHAVDYPPGYLVVLWLTGKLSASPGYLLLKLPPILADLGLAWIAGTFAARLAPAELKARLPVRALVAAVVLWSPATIALSAVWGQVDSVPVAFVAWSLLLLFTGQSTLRRDLAAFALLGIAFSMKPQTGFALPVVLYALYRRYLRRRRGGEIVDGALAVALMVAVFAAIWVASGLVFGLGPVSLYHFYRHASSVHPYTSANAFNLWGLLGSWRSDATGADVLSIAGIPALRFGLLLFVLALVAVVVRVHRAIERGADRARLLTLAAALASLLGYTLTTRMHERYMFIALALLAPLLFSRPLRLVYGALSVLFVLNLWFAFAYYNSQVPGIEALKLEPFYGWLFGGFAFDTWQKRLVSALVTAIALTAAWRGLAWLRGEPEPEPAPAGGAPSPGPRAPELRLPLLPSLERLVPGGDELAEAGASVVARWLPAGLVGLGCLFGLIALRGETTAAQNLNDSAFHEQMVRWAGGQIGEGRLPLDGWYPYFAAGSSFFHHYQSLPHTLTAYLARATGASDGGAYLWLQYLLLALWPIAVYAGARLLGWSPWTSAAAAAVAPLVVSAPGYGYEDGSYTWRGYGVYSQLWAMWLLPLAWGLTWRAVSRGRRYAAAAAAVALTIACHFITGYLAVLTVGVWVLVLGFGPGLLARAGRAALAAGGGLVIALWVLVPLIADTRWTNRSEYYRGTIFNDSYGAAKVLGWLFEGELFDDGRFPIVTILFFAGVLYCALRWRQDVRARAVLGAFALSLLLFFGRRTWGGLIDVLPGFGDVQIHRFVMGVHLAGILLAGIGLAWLFRLAAAALRGLELRPPALAVGAGSVLLAVGLLAPAWLERARWNDYGAHLIRSQRAADATDGRDLDRLLSIVEARRDGRTYAGLRANWGGQYRVGSVPVYAWLADRDVDAIGFVFRTIGSLSTDVEAAFDETNPAQYEMLNVRYLLLPSERPPPVPARLLASSGRHRLYEVRTSGYVQVVDRAAPIAANRTDVQRATRSWRSSRLASRGIYPGIAWDGAAGPAATFAGASPPPGAPGAVLGQENRLQDGVFAATVVARRPAAALLKASFDPRWTATVDGVAAKPVMIAPSLVGVDVPAGRHAVRFRYRPVGDYPLLLTLGGLGLLGLAAFPRRRELARALSGLPARVPRRRRR